VKSKSFSFRNSIQSAVAYLAAMIFVLAFGCATAPEVQPRTLRSDIYPEKLTRTLYYQNMGESAVIAGEHVQAIEYYRLALLHDPQNRAARFQLADTYLKTGQTHLAALEMDKYVSLKSSLTDLSDIEKEKICSIYEKAGAYQKIISFLTLPWQIKDDYAPKAKLSHWSLWKIYESQSKIGSYAEARKTLETLKNQSAGDSESDYLLLLAQADLSQKQNQFDQAIDYLSAAEKLKPLDRIALEKKIDLEFKQQRWMDLSRDGLKYNEYHPYNIVVSEKWAHAAIKLEDYDVALHEIQKQRKIEPEALTLRYQEAHVLFLKKDYDQALTAYQWLYDETGSDQSTFYLAQILLIKKENAKASEILDELTAESEYYSTAQVQIARVEWPTDHDKALNRLRKAHLERQDSLELYREYAQYLIWTNNLVECVSLLEKANRYHPEDDQLKILSAFNHFKLGNEKQFNRNIKIAIEKNPANSEIYSVMAQLWYEKQKPASELEYLAQKAIDLKSEDKNVKPLLAWALLQQNRLTNSVALFEEFYDANPNEAFYAESLAEIYARHALPLKTQQYDLRAAQLKVETRIKNDLSYFHQQFQADKIDSQKLKTRLPASLD